MGFESVDLVRVLVDEVEASRATFAKAKNKVECQKELLSNIDKSSNNAMNVVESLRVLVVAAGTREAYLLSSASAASNQIARDTTELPQARNTISTHSRDLAKIA